MPHHFAKHVTEAYVFCNTCHKLTLHFVSDGRQGPCKEHEHPGLVNGMTKKQRERKEQQEKEKREPRLF